MPLFFDPPRASSLEELFLYEDKDYIYLPRGMIFLLGNIKKTSILFALVAKRDLLKLIDKQDYFNISLEELSKLSGIYSKKSTEYFMKQLEYDGFIDTSVTSRPKVRAVKLNDEIILKAYNELPPIPCDLSDADIEDPLIGGILKDQLGLR